MEHQVTPIEKLHHEEQVVLGLEGTDEVGEEGTLPGERQHPLLHHGTLYIIVNQHHVLLQTLDCKVLVFALQLCQQHLAKAAFAKYFLEGEVLKGAPGAPLPDLAIGPVVV